MYMNNKIMYDIFSDTAIAAMLGTVSDTPGRINQTYVIGEGLSQDGVSALSRKLACLTIEDLESILGMRGVDTGNLTTIYTELRDLTKALVCTGIIQGINIHCLDGSPDSANMLPGNLCFQRYNHLFTCIVVIPSETKFS